MKKISCFGILKRTEYILEVLNSEFQTMAHRRLCSSSASVIMKTTNIIKKELRYTCHSYHPLPVALSRGKGIYVWDVEGKRYMDFLSGYSATNHGHCHPRLMDTLTNQASKLHHVSRAFHSDVLGEFAEFICNLFEYDKMLPMNTGVEACDSACKIARKWGYMIKGINKGHAKIVFAEGNFWGRSLAAVSSSTDPTSYGGYEPLMPGFEVIPYNNIRALEESFQDTNVCGFMVEPIQGEAGVIVPDKNYLGEVRKLCNRYNVVWIADEVQTGLGRTGKMLCVDHSEVRPDLLVLGKSLAGGMYPVSVVLADDHIMNVITPGTHGSTFGGNPLGSKMAIVGLKILIDEQLIENSESMGLIMRQRLEEMQGNIITAVRGKGLMNAIDINTDIISGWDLCIMLKNHGILTKLCHEKTLRLSPPLIIKEKQLAESMDLMETAINSIKLM